MTITFSIISFIAGVVVGALVYRRNPNKIDKEVKKVKSRL